MEKGEEGFDVVLMQISCIGCTACARVCPEVFKMSNVTGLADMEGATAIHPLVQKRQVGLQQLERVIECTELCPTDSILVWNRLGKLLNRKPLASFIRPSHPYK